ncbi:hypothetical protein PF002_g4947 [Phytophthora fragariae]|uniref:DDE-1 domain-containing protein n=1 Tax=Phytophthora fragariae TaxID=53985 RepID=A0A6A4A2G9_9STRA|nr:hypothetical protein PF002_g4947 [Phytophthora fragariae]
MGQRRGKYSDDELEAAVQAVLAGTSDRGASLLAAAREGSSPPPPSLHFPRQECRRRHRQQRPLLLVMDGCASRISLPIVAAAESLGIIPVCPTGLPNSHRDAAWLQVCRIVRREILVLPARAARKTKRKRMNTSGRILTRKLLEEDSKTSSERAKQPKRLPARKPRVDQPEIMTEAWV